MIAQPRLLIPRVPEELELVAGGGGLTAERLIETFVVFPLDTVMTS